MQCFLSLIVCAFLVISQAAPVIDQYEEDMRQRKVIALECIDQVHINKSIIEVAMSDYDNLPSDQKYKDFLACSYKKQKFQSTDGKMLFGEINQFLGRFYETQDLQILNNCKNVTGRNDGEVAYNSLKCIIPYLKELETREEKIELNSV